MKRLMLIGFILGVFLTGCSSSDSNVFEDSFARYDDASWRQSNGYSNGSVFDCTWRKENVDFDDGTLILRLLDEPSSATPKYSGGEYRTTEKYGYGVYTVRMKPAKNVGIVSSFFTYTGPSEDEPWDEIDIEFLGKDTTKVQFNYFTNGKKPSGEFLYDLEFDAADDFHEYSFDWQKDSITWYVDGKLVYTATKDIPTTPGRIMMNIWPGIKVDGWLGAYDGTTPLSVSYDWVRYEPSENE